METTRCSLRDRVGASVRVCLETSKTLAFVTEETKREASTIKEATPNLFLIKEKEEVIETTFVNTHNLWTLPYIIYFFSNFKCCLGSV